MKLPGHEHAFVPKAKIVDYLLSANHPDGWGKAQWFTQAGFSVRTWKQLAEALLRHATENEVSRVEDSPFGKRYVIEGPLESPDGRNELVRAVWFIDSGQNVPRFVTAYPFKRGKK